MVMEQRRHAAPANVSISFPSTILPFQYLAQQGVITKNFFVTAHDDLLFTAEEQSDLKDNYDGQTFDHPFKTIAKVFTAVEAA